MPHAYFKYSGPPLQVLIVQSFWQGGAMVGDGARGDSDIVATSSEKTDYVVKMPTPVGLRSGTYDVQLSAWSLENGSYRKLGQAYYQGVLSIDLLRPAGSRSVIAFSGQIVVGHYYLSGNSEFVVYGGPDASGIYAAQRLSDGFVTPVGRTSFSYEVVYT